MRVNRFITNHESPVFSMMVGVNDGECPMVHVSVLGISGYIEKLEFY